MRQSSRVLMSCISVLWACRDDDLDFKASTRGEDFVRGSHVFTCQPWKEGGSGADEVRKSVSAKTLLVKEGAASLPKHLRTIDFDVNDISDPTSPTILQWRRRDTEAYWSWLRAGCNGDARVACERDRSPNSGAASRLVPYRHHRGPNSLEERLRAWSRCESPLRREIKILCASYEACVLRLSLETNE